MTDFFKRIEGLSPKRLALLALEQQERLDELERDRNDPVAVIGLGCRIPGGVASPDEYWELLLQGRDAITEIPANRWDINSYFDPNPDTPGRMATRWGGFVQGHDRFDAPFFGISRKEAVSLDPQQRLLLETSWEALEHAGISPHALSGSPTGVFLGLSTLDYHTILLSRGQEHINPYHATGTAHSIASGRIAYVLGLHGPNMAVDTACSSSLVAVHLACQSLRNQECRLALAGGVNMILSPDITIALSRSRMMAPGGRCKAFDASADGFVRSEGCGILVLKRLSQAQADGDRVLAVIRGSAVNQDGRSSGITAPNGAAQQAVIRQALTRAAVEPGQIQYVEAHGTGTSLGDPIEAHALSAVLGRNRTPDRPLIVGSVKTNIGHLESAAGAAGLIKVVLSLQNECIPPHLHFKKMNPHIDWMGMPVEIPVAAIPWKRGERPRLAGVSSFGFGGTNAHLIVEEAPALLARQAEASPREVECITLSARGPAALETLAGRLADHLEAHPEARLDDVCFTANVGRAHLPERAVCIARSRNTLTQALRHSKSFARGHVQGQAQVAFLFSGQGTQYAAMGRQLYESEPAFRQAFDECGGLLKDQLRMSLQEVVFGGATGLLNDTTYTQPALFSLQWSLAALWRSWGVEPAAVVGHSVGEYAAAALAGVCSLADSLRLIAARGCLMGGLPPGGGAMAAILAPGARVAEAVQRLGSGISIAAFNGPENVVVSGNCAEVEHIEKDFANAGFRVERLRVGFGAHSPQMAVIETEFRNVAAQLRFQAPRISLISSVTGNLASETELADPNYWRRQLREPVLFERAMDTLAGLGCSAFVEIGPGSTLLGMGRELIEKEGQLWTPSIRRSRPDLEQMTESLAELYVRGVPVDWAGYYAGRDRRKTTLPTYPFEHQRYWPDLPAEPRRTPMPAAQTDLLGTRTESAIPTYHGAISESSAGWIQDHRVGDTPVVPASCFLEAAARAGRELLGSDAMEIRGFSLSSPLRLEPGIPFETESVIIAETGRNWSFRLFGRPLGETKEAWTEHMRASLSAPAGLPPAANLPSLRTRLGRQVSTQEFYQRLNGSGIDLRERCQTIQTLWAEGGEALAQFQSGNAAATLDGCFQALGAAVLWREEGTSGSQPHVLASIDRLHILAPFLEEGFAHARITREPAEYLGELTVFSLDGSVALHAEGIHLRPMAHPVPLAAPADWFYEVQWKPAGALGNSVAGGAISRQEAIARRAEALATATGLSIYEQVRPRLDALVSSYVARALADLGVTWNPGAVIDPSAISTQAGVLKRHRRLLDRMIAILEEDGIVGRSPEPPKESWRVLHPPQLLDEAAEARSLRETFPAFAAESELTERCGAKLSSVLRGLADPLQLLTTGGDFTLLDQLYTGSPAARTFNAAAAEAMQEAVRLAGGQPLRAVEIGAGTGGTSAFLLPVLQSNCAEYLFTDLSPTFLGRAEERFRQYPFLRTAVMDIDQPPAGQGVPEGSFDLVIAANVLHATENIRRTVANAIRLARPGGLFVFLEGTRPERWVDLTFGMTEGWWKFDDDLRPASPLLDGAAWLSLLKDLGVSETAIIQPPASQQALLLGRCPSTVTAARSANVIIAAADGNGFEADVCAQLRTLGINAVAVSTAGMHAALTSSSYDHAVLLGSGAELVCQRVAESVRTLTFSEAKPPKLWAATRGAQFVPGDTSITPEQAILWGLGRTASLEHPDLWGGLIDFDSNAAAESIAAGLAAELTSSSGEDQVAYRAGRRYIPRLMRTALPTRSAPRLDPEGVYLVSGGLGNLGLQVASWLAALGARHILLASRRKVRDSASPLLDRLRAQGVAVHTVAADISTGEGIDALREAITPRRLHGIVHTAAVFDSAPLANLSPESLRAVLRPKMEGSLALAGLAKGEPLEFFVLFSSSTSLLGVSGMAAYAAANQYLDALAYHLRAQGCPAVSVNWGTWDQMGDLADEIRQMYARTGLKPMKADLALAGLGQALAASVTQISIADIDWSALKPVYEARRRRPLLENVANIASASQRQSETPDVTLASLLAQAPEEERMEKLTSVVREEAATILGLTPDEVDQSLGLFEMGMDSLMTVDLKRRLEQRCGFPLPSTLTFNYPSVAALSQFLAGKLGIGAEPASPSPSRVATTPPPEDPLPEDGSRDELSEDELAGLLARALKGDA